MRILGVDPGLLRTGYGVIDAGKEGIKMVQAGVVLTSPKDGISLRVQDIYRNITAVILESKPSVLVLEKLYSHYKHPATSILMGHSRGVVCLACGINGLKLVNYASTRIKKSITGNGHAGKYQVREMVKDILKLTKDPEPMDVSDALAMAISYVFIDGVRAKG
ncbi:MAG: crossover junction endodeoxyribonuclease RuvC [Candidatus Omnitrophota bacterium]